MKSTKDHLLEISNIAREMSECNELAVNIEKIVTAGLVAISKNKKIILAGNGGSAADSQHMAAEYVSRFAFNRPALAAIALTVDTSIITSIGNDYGFEEIFCRQIEAIGQEGDILFAYSTSGKSKNILKAIEASKNKKIISVLFTGINDENFSVIPDIIVRTPSKNTAKIQEGHLMLGHIICGQIEQRLFADES
jgi:D-sedoheptulose 7-phosphate isomerase